MTKVDAIKFLKTLIGEDGYKYGSNVDIAFRMVESDKTLTGDEMEYVVDVLTAATNIYRRSVSYSALDAALQALKQ